MKRIALTVLAVWLTWAPGMGTAHAEASASANGALKAAARNDWSSFRQLRDHVDDALTRKILQWVEYREPGSGASFESIAAFMAANPQWPEHGNLQRRAEEAMEVGIEDSRVLAWFTEREPLSTDGWIRYGAALLRSGQTAKGEAVLRRTWVNGNFGPKQETQFLALYGKYLTKADHENRLDRLLWEDRDGPAEAMLRRVSPDVRALGTARLALSKQAKGIDRVLAAVPKHLANHPGLIFERVRWHRQKNRADGAVALLLGASKNMGQPEKWWPERSVLARQALRRGHITDAYRIAAGHGTGSGEAMAEGEWMAGWIALRFLNDADVALNHFSKLYDAVSYPISRARAAYWAGRATEALGRSKAAQVWFDNAAAHPTTYYGQLAISRLSGDKPARLPSDPVADPREVEAFAGHELTKAARALAGMGQKQYLAPFVTRLNGLSQSAGWRFLVAGLAVDMGRPDLAVRVSKIAGYEGRPLISHGFPTLDLPPYKAVADDVPEPEKPLVLAVIRQESAFDAQAISRAGARGLMQLMPSTAKQVAKQTGQRYYKLRLTADPAYNMTLGRAHLGDLLDRFKGSYVLSLAAYNAGGARVNQWIDDLGDPRDPSVDVIDWIEQIPFSETRNYVQRILESIQVYRSRLEKTEVALNLPSDLNRRTRQGR